MSFPNIPNITPTISVTTAQTIPLLLSSIALEELALAHMINAEAEKLQLVLGTLQGGRTLSLPVVTISNLLDIDSSVQRTLRDVIKKEMLLEFKFENVLDLIATLPPTPPPSTVTVTLIADPTTTCAFQTGPNTSTLTGQVLVNGSPPPVGTLVSFLVSAGSVTPNPALTDASGNFTATFFAAGGSPSMVDIIATALGTNSNTVTITLVNCQTTFTLNADPSTVCAAGTGSNMSVITGTLLVNGSPPPVGTQVDLSIVDNPGLGVIVPNIAFTDASGNFTATFFATDGGPGVSIVASAFGVSSDPLAITIINCPG